MRAKVNKELCAQTDRGRFDSPARRQLAPADLATLPAEKITRGLAQDVQAFSAGHGQSDDFSGMAVRWRGPAFAVTPR
jgi:serine phosphatase RsbU (regulator of sigma subunit)